MAAATAAAIVAAVAAAASTTASIENQNNARRQANQAANGARQDQNAADKRLQAQTLKAEEDAASEALRIRQRGGSSAFDKNGTILTSPLGTVSQPGQAPVKTLLGQ